MLAVLGSRGIGNKIEYFLDKYFDGNPPEVECFTTVEKLLEKAQKQHFDAVAVSYSPFIGDGLGEHIHEIMKVCGKDNVCVLAPWNTKEALETGADVFDPLGDYKDLFRFVEKRVRDRT